VPVTQQRRIPARKSGPYAAWALPAVTEGVVVKAETAGVGGRRIDAGVAQAEAVHGQSFARELEENIKAGRYARGVSARELETIVRHAADDGRREGYDEGFARGRQEGYEAGHAEGLAAGRKYLEEAAGRFAGLLESLHKPLLGQDEALREAMLEVTAQIARAVVRAELVIQPQAVAHVIEEALAALPLGARNVRVYVSPADRTLLEDFGAGEAVPVLLSDAALAPGDCRVEAAESLVDFRQSARLAAILEQFLGRAGVADGGA
jgi:flagellar assembly protein FliH